MKKLFVFAIVILTLALCVCFTSCDNGKEEETSAAEATTVADTTVAEATTAEETTAAEVTTVAETTAAEVTTAEATAAEETTESGGTEAEDPNDPKTHLVAVGTGPDGKTTAYNGYYQFDEDYFLVNDEWYYSIQEAVDACEGLGGRFDVMQGMDMGVCLKVEIPDDGCFYRIPYNWCNVDFVFNRGLTFDDDTPAGQGADWPEVHGYAYYSDFEPLDEISGLDGCHVFVWSTTEGFAPGYYELQYVGNYGSSSGYNYEYVRIGDIEDYWPGLPGEERQPE